MKTITKTTGIAIALAVCAALAINSSSCSKKNTQPPPADTVSFSEANAAQLTTDALTPPTGGFTAQLSSISNVYDTGTLSCGVQKDSSIADASASGITPVFNYSLSWNYILTCSGTAPSLLTGNFTGTGSYTGVVLSSSFNNSGQFTWTGFGQSVTEKTFTTSIYERKGTATLNSNSATFNSDIQIQSSNIVISKTIKEIVSGTATVSIMETSSSGQTFNFKGVITFNGNRQATLVLNSGTSYTITWTAAN